MSDDGDYLTKLLIGGELVAGAGAPIAVENPYTTETIVDGVGGLPRAGRGGRRRRPRGLAGLGAHPRRRALRAAARGGAAAARATPSALARTMTAEGGKPLLENRDELEWTAAAFDYYAEIGRDHAGRVIPPIESSQLAMVVKDPLGVVGCIVPWNYPLLLLAWKVAPALAAGNCVVCKPSELTPLSTLMLAGAFEHLPAGVVSLLAGAGEVGAALASPPRRRLHRLHRLGRDRQEGGRRLHRADGADEPRDGRQGRLHRLRRRRRRSWRSPPAAAPGRPSSTPARSAPRPSASTSPRRSSTTTSAPSSSTPAASSSATPSRSRPTSARWSPRPSAPRSSPSSRRPGAAGAEILVGGDDGGTERGHFLSPAVVTGAAPDSALLREETFGPVAPLVPVSSLDEAIELANGTEFGLGANVYTGDLESAIRCMRELRAGTVWINDPLTDNDAGPFGGFKQSGLGRELGREGLEAFQETKHVHMESKIERKEWWYPYREYGSDSQA